MITRHDPRYVTSDDESAVLVACAGPSLAIDMGGWTENSPQEFLEALRDELRFCIDFNEEYLEKDAKEASKIEVSIRRRIGVDGFGEPVWESCLTA